MPKGRGALCAPSIISIFSADCYKIWYRCKTSHALRWYRQNSQGHYVGRISTKCDKKLGNMIEKIRHALKDSNV